ncbi:hypothetical protein MPTK1_5g11400 [Marchantia polymorpha subsp. ruderalis]|uniref:Uncharacterized protein n=2 Tax=Marchantia polymorpha TaxID=3197 RepID=A0AAF6BH95_MARPO|nr:hypothetical protein MARPO_0093s0063 [Marchantia polymorpha]BBN11379.1 hypothetical protein Mp_5g11400 [Marchantia polymorpha subsp. ruderalis]|eukprot:PTQ32992.1 hypothetical protein MARPO_0093s0063 [Marchantia polymorpha]
MGLRVVDASLLLVLAAAVLVNVGTAGASESGSVRSGLGSGSDFRVRTLLQTGTDRGRFPDCSRNASACLDPKLTPDGPDCCFGRCFNIRTSANHCGGCGNLCGYRQSCCSGRCVNLLIDELNCGRCGVVCDDACENGICGYSS